MGLYMLFTARNRPGRPEDAPRDLHEQEAREAALAAAKR